MRRLKHLVRRLNEERGATAVIVAVTLTAMMGMAAFAIDFGALYAERRQLQSGADAGALAIAEDCGLGKPCTTGTATSTAASYAASNANDGSAGIESVDLNTGAQKVTVNTKTRTSDGSDIYKPFLAQVIGFNGTTVNAKATAIWGYPNSMTVLPLMISDCEWQTAQVAGDSEDCPAGPAGHDADLDGTLPGGFGWLEGSCAQVIQVGDWKNSKGGNSTCSSLLNGPLPRVILIPYYDDVIACNGSEPACDSLGLHNDKWYHVAGFGAFELTGYKFPSEKDGDNCGAAGVVTFYIHKEDFSPGNWCIVGNVTTGSAPDGELGGPNRGVVVVKLTE